MPQTEDDVAPPPRRGRPRDPERCRRIMEAARSHFNAHGFERASVDAIAADAGVSKMTIYSHFASKEGLFEAVVRDRTDRVMGGLGRGRSAGPEAASEGAAGRRRAVPDAGARGGHTGPVSLALRRRGRAARGVPGFYRQGADRLIGELAAYLRRADAQGTLKIRHPRQAADLFLSMFLGDGHIRGLLMLEMPDARENRALLREAVRVFMAAYAKTSR